MPLTELPKNLIEGLIIGDEQTYIHLFREYYVGLCAYSRRYVGRKDVAEEIVSDTFLKLWETRRSLQINTSIKAYLFRAVCNNSLHYLRKLKNENQLTDFFSDTKFENIGFAVLAEETDAKSLVMDDISQKITEAIDLLPEQQRKAFILKRIEGKKTKEVAEIMQLSVKTVEMHLSKATLKLREYLKECLPAFLLFMLFK